jgi:mycobactin lysine-N-oxygenase
MIKKHLAVVGGGPKAAAVAAKAHVLSQLGLADVHVTIFEPKEIGANWTGRHGYTDGQARLCTPAERDLGFPYDAGVYNRSVASRMYADFSWGAYLIEKPPNGRGGFNDWVNRGRLPPSHADYADYLDWAIKRSGAKVEPSVVTDVVVDGDHWKLRRQAESGSKADGRYNGIVFTGPGDPLNRIQRDGTSNRITDGHSFWSDVAGVIAAAANFDDPIVLIGAGGTSAAIAARLLREHSKREIVIIGDQAALFTRVETFFENQLFSDEDLWRRLSSSTRRDFTDRLNRGVVWATISDQLARSTRLRFEPGRAEKIEVLAGPNGDEVVVVANNDGLEFRTEASIVVDASGFDTWWFSGLMPQEFRTRMEDGDVERQREKRTNLVEGMTKHLALFDEAPGPIHAPMLSQAVGPGFASLMVLGSLSDRVLGRYVTT